jgi:polysaccharide export outer membrane protein
MTLTTWLYRVAFGLTLLSVSACGIPLSGPRGESVELQAASHVSERDVKPLPYCLVSLSPRVASLLAHNQPRLAGRFTDRRGPSVVNIGVGDLIRVTLFESAAGGLFFPLEGGSRTGNFLVIPDQHVDNQGNITVPYAGAVRARGRTPAQVQDAIVAALSSRALEPQAVVTVVDRRDALISVVGEVSTSVRFPASISGERMLDAIARAGGLRGPGQESWVILERGGRVAVSPFEALIHEPHNNIYVRAHDTIYVYREPQTFLAFGAVTTQGQIPFITWRMSLGEALGRAGGLLDARAEPSWVFLFRPEVREFAEKLDPKCAVGDGRFVPVVYQADLRDPATFFLVSNTPMRNKDILYVSNARTVEHTKLMNYIRAINATVQDPIQTAIAGYTLKGLVKGTSDASVIVTTSTTPAPGP